ncbi:MAG: A/G-specific adenine glycosylase [Allosphingosinicella sp.]|uniref:A/G-specific adenine glycosylase n=1 Tax=Allosphingosinicella sp. TaxID=2823234 RepID=UPI00394A33ED
MRWYAVDKRRLPWRAETGETADPYRVWLSEIMLQQTTVAAVKPYFENFTARWPTVEALAAADEAEVMRAWAGLGYYARARNLIACAREVAARGGVFPVEEAELRKLPGIGGYTAAAVAAIVFGKRAVVVDGNVERVVSRLFAVADPLPGAKPRLRELADRLTPADGAGDFAQAMMDLGATICTPRSPACGRCPVAAWCVARAEGRPDTYPVKAKKAAKPRRHWTAYWLERNGEVLLARRPARGLLGGMLALPVEVPAETAWQEAGAVEHVFTHFALSMTVLCGAGDSKLEGEWWPVDRVEEAGLPTVFAKAARRALAFRQVPRKQAA